jgi:hypothetical protein
MEYFLLALGILTTVLFAIITHRNAERKGLLHTIIRVDTFIGIGAGIFIVITSLVSILN